MAKIHQKPDGSFILTKDDGSTTTAASGADITAAALAFFGALKTEVPVSVTMASFQLALDDVGVLTSVNTAINSGGGQPLIFWNKVARVRRDAPIIETIRVNRGWTQVQVDDVFRSAKLKDDASA